MNLPTKVHLVKAMVFPVLMHGCESWTIKKAEGQRIDAFQLWCWRRLLWFPWTARRSNQSILKKISPGCSLEGLMLKLKLQYFVHLMWRTDSFEKTLMLGKIEGRRRRDDRGWDGWMASPTRWTWVWMNSGSWWWIGRPGVLWSMGLQRVWQDWMTKVNGRKLIAFQCSFFLFVRVGEQDLHVRVEIGRVPTVQFVCFKVCVDALWLSRSHKWSLPMIFTKIVNLGKRPTCIWK